MKYKNLKMILIFVFVTFLVIVSLVPIGLISSLTTVALKVNPGRIEDATSWVDSKLKIYYLNSDRKLCSINLDGTDAQTLINAPESSSIGDPGGSLDSYRIFRSPNGQYMSFITHDHKLFLLSHRDGKPEMLEMSAETGRFHKWSSDSQHILVSKMVADEKEKTGESQTLYVIYVTSKEKNRIFSGHHVTDDDVGYSVTGSDGYGSSIADTKEFASFKKSFIDKKKKTPPRCAYGCSGWLDNGEIYIVDMSEAPSGFLYEFYLYDLKTKVLRKTYEQYRQNMMPLVDDDREDVSKIFSTAFQNQNVFRYPDTLAGVMEKNVICAKSKSGSYEASIFEGVNIVIRGKEQIPKLVFTDPSFRYPLINWEGAERTWFPVYWLPDNRHLIFDYPHGLRSRSWKTNSIYVIDAKQQKTGKLTDGHLLYWGTGY